MDGMIGTERRMCSGCSFNDMTYSNLYYYSIRSVYGAPEGNLRMLLFIEMELVNNSRNQWIELSLRYWISRSPHRKLLLSDRPYLYITSLPPAGKMSSILWFHPGPGDHLIE